MGTASKPTAAAPPTTRSARELETLVRAFYDHFNAHQFDRAAAVLAPECEWTDFAIGTTARGPAGFLEYARTWLGGFSDARLELVNVIASGDLVSVEFIGRGTHDGPFPDARGNLLEPTGKQVEQRGIDVMQFRGDQIIRGRTYADSSSLYRQLTPAGKPLVRKPGEGDARWMLDSLFDIKIAGKESGGAFTAVEITAPHAKGPPLHTHDGGEFAYVLDGRVRFHAGGETQEVGAGTVFYAPKGTLETFEPIGDKPARILFLYIPGGIDQFFVEASQPAERREPPQPSGAPPDLEELARLAKKYGVELKIPRPGRG